MKNTLNNKFFITVFLVVFYISLSFCQQAYSVSFSITKKRISIDIFNASKDTMFLPSQAYWEVLPEKSFQIQSDSLIIVLNRVKAEIVVHCNADKVEVNTEDVYWADYYIKPGRTNILEFLLTGKRKWIKPKNINWVVIEWTDRKLIGTKK